MSFRSAAHCAVLALVAASGCVDLKDPAPLSASAADGGRDGEAVGALDAAAPDDSLDGGLEAGFEAGSGGGGDGSVDAHDGAVGPVDRRYANWPLPAWHPLLANYDVGTDIVKDLTTGLIWQRNYGPGTTVNHRDAVAYCQNLVLGGLHDWRLPTRIESLSILDYGQSLPLLNTDVFHDSGFLWTASASLVCTCTHDYFQFRVDTGSSEVDDQENTASVRCVNGGPTTSPAVPFAEQEGTALDTRTGLRWQLVPLAAPATFDGAKNGCASLKVGSFASGWRLPDPRELQTLVDEAREQSPLLPASFSAGPKTTFWAYVPRPALAYQYAVDFADGTSARASFEETHSVRCVLSTGDAGAP